MSVLNNFITKFTHKHKITLYHNFPTFSQKKTLNVRVETSVSLDVQNKYLLIRIEIQKTNCKHVWNYFLNHKFEELFLNIAIGKFTKCI